MVRTGFSDVIGSWKTMAMLLPRMPRICASSRANRSAPSNRIEPPRVAAEARRQKPHDRESGDTLSASRFPRRSQRFSTLNREAHSVDGARQALRRVEMGCAGRGRREGERTSVITFAGLVADRDGRAIRRRPGFTASTTIARHAPGKKIVQGARARSRRLEAIMLPQVAISGGTPAPRNERPASMRIADAVM